MEDSDAHDLALAGSRPKCRSHRDPRRLRRPAKLQKPHSVPSSAPAEDQSDPRNESHSRQANVAALNKQANYCAALPRLVSCPQAVLLMLLSWLPALPSMLSIVAATNRELLAATTAHRRHLLRGLSREHRLRSGSLTAAMMLQCSNATQVVRFVAARPPRDEASCPILILASKAQSVAMAIALVETGMICVNVQDSAGVSAMMVAAHRRKATLLDSLIARRADVNVQDKRGQTALMLSRTEEIVASLLQAKASANTRRHDGASALMCIAADHSPVDNTSRSTMIKMIKNDENVKTAKMLITAGAKVNLRDGHQNSALMLGCSANQPDLVEMLLKSGANYQRQNRAGKTALMLAAAVGNTKAVTCLIKKKAQLDVCDCAGNNALVLACQSGGARVTRMLVAAAEKSLREHHSTADKWYQEVLQALLSAAEYNQDDAEDVMIGAIISIALRHLKLPLKQLHQQLQEKGLPPDNLNAVMERAAVDLQLDLDLELLEGRAGEDDAEWDDAFEQQHQPYAGSDREHEFEFGYDDRGGESDQGDY